MLYIVQCLNIMTYLIKAFGILNNEEKYKLCFVFFFALVATFLEMFGIVLFLPVITILLKGSSDVEKLNLFNFDLSFIANLYTENILFISLVLLVCVFFLKNIFLFFFNFYNYKFINDIGARLSTDIFKKYLNKDFSFYLKNSSSELINHCVYVADGFKDTLSNIIIMISEFLVLVGIIVLLLTIEPKGFLLSLIFITSIGLFMYLFSNKIIIKWGRQILKFEQERYLHLSQAFAGIKEIKVFNKTNFFFNKYLTPNQKRFKIATLVATFTSLPRYLIEVLFILTLTLFLFFLKLNDKSNHEIILIMSLFAVASIRIIPSLNRILSSYQSYKFGFKVIETIYDEIKNPEFLNIDNNKNLSVEKNKKINQNYLIKLENIFYKYNSEDKYILKNVNLTISKKEFIGVIGKTGSGKSTLINIILNLLKPTAGKIYLNFSKTSFVPQSPYLIDDTILNNIALGIEESKINIDLINKCLKDVQLDDFINSLPKAINTYVGEKGIRISGGELQRLAIARALYVKPDLIVLDEPTNSLDKITEKKIIEMLKILCQSTSISIVFITHHPNNLQYCDKVIKINNNQACLLDKNEVEIFN